MIKVEPNFCEIFGRNAWGVLEILFSGYNYSNSLLQSKANSLRAAGYTDVEALRGGESIN